MTTDRPPPPLDVDRIVETLTRHEVDFVVIGGIAVLAHGHPRATFDLDVMAPLDEDNMRRFAQALDELNAEVRGVDGDLLEVDPTDPEQLASGANWTFTTDAGWLDFMPAAQGARDYDAIATDAVPVRDGAFRVVGLDDLIRMKRAAGREKDIDDIAALTHLGPTD
ncbi:MAG: hypothetical protein R3320_05010 [Nitriliruptorales bacterium]|nr:hypothetical protein [Nitriliruptorales bacterium]